jgi:purine nucleoside permease
MIFQIFLPKNLAKMLAFFAQDTAIFLRKLIITSVFDKNANFFSENWQKSQKIVIITSTPGHPDLACPITLVTSDFPFSLSGSTKL